MRKIWSLSPGNINKYKEQVKTSLISIKILYIAWFNAYLDISIIISQNFMHARTSNVDQIIFEMFFELFSDLFFQSMQKKIILFNSFYTSSSNDMNDYKWSRDFTHDHFIHQKISQTKISKYVIFCIHFILSRLFRISRIIIIIIIIIKRHEISFLLWWFELIYDDFKIIFLMIRIDFHAWFFFFFLISFWINHVNVVDFFSVSRLQMSWNILFKMILIFFWSFFNVLFYLLI
jgi:hypothetical protein